MQQYLDSIRLSLATKNYFGAIAMALTLPDICASIEAENNETSREKYCAWFDSYVGITTLLNLLLMATKIGFYLAQKSVMQPDVLFYTKEQI